MFLVARQQQDWSDFVVVARQQQDWSDVLLPHSSRIELDVTCCQT